MSQQNGKTVATLFGMKHLVQPFWIVVLLGLFVELNGMGVSLKPYQKNRDKLL